VTQSLDAGILPLERKGYQCYARLAIDLAKYAVASVAALATDYGVLMLCYKLFGMNYLVAASVGFTCGLGVVYFLSVHFVFGGRRRLGAGPEFIGFLLTGVVGLILNEALMGLFVEHVGLSVALAKIPTAGFVFAFNFLTRRALLFSAQEGAVKTVALGK
jgi:putative flippase GtrA